MRQFLLFRLYGVMASWGDITVGEIRPTAGHPSKSALVGLLAAALGYKRDEDDKIRSLAAAFGAAVRADVDSLPLRDYHTYQRGWNAARNTTPIRTRRDELNADNIGTGLSTRDYRTDALYTACLWRTEETSGNHGSAGAPGVSLAALAEALLKPHFTLYLGRKSCPLALPIRPVAVEAATVREAFAQAKFSDAEFLAPLVEQPRNKTFAPRYYWQECDFHGFERHSSALRRDEPRSRTKWQFGERFEYSAVEDITLRPQLEEFSELKPGTSESQWTEDS